MPFTDLQQSETQRVYDDITGAIGHTPLVRLNRLGRGLACPVYAKLEFLNPGGSVKDRIALNILEEAEQSGRLKPGGTVVEATSGNTGVGLAIACAIKGYRPVFVLPDKMSSEKIQLLRAFGARVLITPTAVEPDDPRSYYSVARRVVQETPNAILANQYHNPENPRSHYQTTGPEIWEQTGGKVTDVIISMGTGGTISGVGHYLKERNPSIRIVGVDPQGSILQETWQLGRVPEGAQATPYKVEGIGEDFLPSTLDLTIIDQVIQTTDREAFLTTRRLVKDEGIFAGGSSGAAVAAAIRYTRDLPSGRLVVVILPDSGSRYLSKIFDDKWMRENGFLEASWSEVSLGSILESKSANRMITAHREDALIEVISLLRTHGISQVPVVDGQGTVTGLVTEVDLLKHMLSASHEHTPDESIAPIVQPVQAVFPANTPLAEALPSLVEGYVVLVTDGSQPIGILTKIDILDYIARDL